MNDEATAFRDGLTAPLAAIRPGLDLLGMPACVLDAGMRYRFVNAGYAAHFDRQAAEFLNHTYEEIFRDRLLDDRREMIERALGGEAVVSSRRTAQGPRAGLWVRAHYFPLRAESGEVVGVLIVLIDIHEDRELREAFERQAAELRYFAYFANNLPSPIAVVDAEFRYVFANKAFQSSRGEAREALVGRKVSEVMGAEAAEYLDPYAERLKRGETCAYEVRMGPPGGQPRWQLVSLAPIMDGEGRFDGYYSVGSDIHDLKLGQERVRAQEAQLRLFTDNIPDAVAYLDRGRRFQFANRPFAEQRGLRPEEVIGKTTAQLLGHELASWIAQGTQKVFDRGEVATYERLVTLPGGERRWFHVKAVPHFDASGVVVGMYVVAHDITEVKEAHGLLAAHEEELRFFAENIPEAIVYIDLERGCTFVNNVFLASRGFSREFALGKFPAKVYPPAVMAELAPHLERVVQGEERHYERLARLPSGEDRWVRVRLTPRRDAAGVVRGYYVVSTDIHDVKSAHAEIEEKQRELRQVIDSIPSPMVYVDAEARYRYVNDAFLAYIGLPGEQVVGRGVREVLGEERWAMFAPFLDRVKAGETLAVERLIRFADGRSRWMTVRLTPRFSDQRYMGYYATTSDIHEQKMIEEELRRAHTILSAHFDNTPLAVIEWDTGLRIVRWSGQAEAIFGWQAAEILGRSLHAWRHTYQDDEPAVTRMVRDLVEGRERHATLLHRNYRKDGTVIWVEWHYSALRDDSGRVISILSLAQDVSSRIQAEERLQYMATHDGLTGLPNSVLLNDRLDAALARARRARLRVGVMFLDLDHFKDVNDTLGHRVGDALLKELARRIRAALRQTDVLARISGDEFVIVLEDLPDEGSPERVARKILDEVRRPFMLEGNEIHVSGSLGLALHPEDGGDADTLLKNADAAMYHAKELGRNSFRTFSSELAARRAQRLQIETALRRALREGELLLYYQPIVDIATGEVHRAEALLRWNDPERGLMLPQGFIPLAEETGLGHAVGAWVLEAACRQARLWRESGLGPIIACVNLSASQLRDTSMIAELHRILTETGCEPGWLQFEITETSMVRDVEGASLILTKLRSLGVRIAIDDFGTGFSSLSHLRHLPVDVLKIDKGFVADIDIDSAVGDSPRRRGAASAAARARRRRGDRAGGAAIVSAVIGLARGLGLDVVAEGVEKKSQLAFLAREGCRSCQGYLLCPPLPVAEFERWLRSRAAKPSFRPERRGPDRVASKHPAKRKK